MASIRKHRDKWQVRIRRAGLRPMSKSFAVRKDATEWARQIEVKADRAELPTDPKALQRVNLGELVKRYRDTVSVKKRGMPVIAGEAGAILKTLGLFAIRVCRHPVQGTIVGQSFLIAARSLCFN